MSDEEFSYHIVMIYVTICCGFLLEYSIDFYINLFKIMDTYVHLQKDYAEFVFGTSKIR